MAAMMESELMHDYKVMVLEYPASLEDIDGQSQALALVVMRKRTGFLLAVPDGAITDVALAEGLVAAPEDMLGQPAKITTAAGVKGSMEDAVQPQPEFGALVEVVLIDVSDEMDRFLSPFNLDVHQTEAVLAFSPEQFDLVPMPGDLTEKAWAWVTDPSSGERVVYYTATEEEEAVPETPRDPPPGSAPLPPRRSTSTRSAQPKATEGTAAKKGRPTVANLAANLETVSSALPALMSQLTELRERQEAMEQRFSGAALPRPSALQQPLGSFHTAGLHQSSPSPATLLKSMPPPRSSSTGVLHPSKPHVSQEEVIQLAEEGDNQDESGNLARAVFAQSQALTALVSHLTNADPISDLSASSSGLSTKGSANRIKLQQELAQHKGTFYLSILHSMARRMQPSRVAEQSPQELAARGVTPTAYVERYGRFGRNRELGSLMWQVALILDHLQSDNISAAKDATALLAVCLEQAALDGGKMDLALLLSLTEDPPAGVFTNRSLAGVTRGRAFAPLAEQKWVTTAVAFVREMDLITTKRQDVTGSKQEKPIPTQPGPKGEPKEKAKGEREGQSESEGGRRISFQQPCTADDVFGVPLKASGLISFRQILASLPRWILKTRTRFSAFLAKSFHIQCCGQASASMVFPFPLMDFGLFERGASRLSSRRLGTLLRKRLVHVLILALNYIEGALNWKNFDMLGRRANRAQRRIHRRLAAFVTMCDTPDGVEIPAAPGRSGPEFIARLSELEKFARTEGQFDLKQYASSGAERGREVERTRVGEVRCSEDSMEIQPYANLNADRLKLAGTGSWRIEDFLDGPLWLPFLEPRILQHGKDFDRSLGPSFLQEDPSEYLRLAKKWDQLGLLGLSADPPHQETYTRIFNAYKNSEQDRQIGDRRLANLSEYKLQGPSKFLPSGALICNVHVKKGQVLIGTATDRKDFYHQCHVTRQRANSNVMPFSYPVDAFEGLSALEDFRKNMHGTSAREDVGDKLGFKPRGVLTPPTKLFPTFQSILQGDHLGVEFALQGHQQLLQSNGLLEEQSRIRGHHPFPLGSKYEGLVIDDYFSISAQHVNQPVADSEARRMLERASDIYERHGVRGSPEKDVTGSRHFKVVGAEVNSSDKALSLGLTLVGAPLEKRAAMAMLSLRVASLPIISSTVAARLAGNWTSIFMFRRCISCILNELYSFGTDCEKLRTPVYALPRSTAEELVLCSVFAFVAATNVAADYSERIFATDASMHKGAIVSRSVSPEIARVMWLGGDKKGCYTSLDPPFRALRRAHEFLVEETEEIEEDKATPQIPEGLQFTFDFVEICGGVGSVSKALAAKGRNVMPPIELSDSPHFDIRELKLVCTSFSPAAHPSVRSYKQPRGFDMTNPKVQLGNVIAFRCLFLLWFAANCDRPALGEQPRLSKMCWLSVWRFLLEQKGFAEAVIASCQFGSPHRKEFRMIGKGIPMTTTLERKCPGGHAHVRIEGKFTKPSAIYTAALAEHLAQAFHVALRTKRAQAEDEPCAAGLESTLANDLLMTGSWRVELAWLWRSPSHINILESHAFVTLLKSLLPGTKDQRITALLDSRVAKGSHAKGRSSARALQPSLKKSAAYQISGGIYPALGFAPTRLNVADAPSRDRDLPETADWSLADFLSPTRAQALHAIGLSRHCSGWVRLSLLLLLLTPQAEAAGSFGLIPQISVSRISSAAVGLWTFAGSWISWIFGLSSADILGCFPAIFAILWISISFAFLISPCRISLSPSRASWIILVCFNPEIFLGTAKSHGMQPLPLVPWCSVFAEAMPLQPTSTVEEERAIKRSSSILVADRVVQQQTRSRREKLLDDFESWLIVNARTTLAALIEAPYVDSENVANLLIAYGKELYYSGKAYGKYAETINAVTSKRSILKRQVVGAWDLAFAWVAEEPHSHHPAMPLSILLAFASLSMLWGWPTEAAIWLMTWSGLLRIGETLAASRRDLILPGDGAPGVSFALLQIQQPKTRGVAAKHQAARIDPLDVVRLLRAVFGKLDGDDRLWRFSPSTLRRRFSQLQGALGLPTKRTTQEVPYDLGSLRPGGATHLLHQFEDAELVRRRGRWLSARVCEIYLQETAVVTHQARLSASAQQKIGDLAACFKEILEKTIHFLDSHIPEIAWPRLW